MQKFERSDVIYENPVIALHHFHGTRDKGSVFIVPPHAGRHGNVVQNLADTLSGACFDTYAMELKAANKANCNTSIGGLVNGVDTCVNLIGKLVDMLGVCQGGWLSSIYAASSLNQDRVKRLALFAAPINCKTGVKNSSEEYCKAINLDAHQFMIDLNGGIQDGWWQWLSFTAANPKPMLYDRYVELFNLWVSCDFDGIAKWVKVNLWLDSPQDLAGVWFMEAMRYHFTNNDLYEGRLIVNGETVNLKNITCPLYVYSGADDTVTHPQQASDILKIVSSKKKKHTCFEGAGHTAVFTRPLCIQQVMADMYGTQMSTH